MIINPYLNHISIDTLLIGLVILLVLIIISLLLIFAYKNKLKTDFKEENISPLRILENFEGIAFNCMIDEDWTMNYVSSNAYKVIGYTSEELVNNSLISYNSIIHPQFKKMVRERYDEAIKNNESINIEYKIITKDGDERWVAEEANIIYDQFQKPLYVDGFIYNIEYRKSLLSERNQYHMRYLSLINSLDYPFIVLKEKKIVEVNPAALSLFRADDRHDIVGHEAIDFISEKYHDFFKKRIDRIKETKTPNLPTNYVLN